MNDKLSPDDRFAMVVELVSLCDQLYNNGYPDKAVETGKLAMIELAVINEPATLRLYDALIKFWQKCQNDEQWKMCLLRKTDIIVSTLQVNKKPLP